jgi:TolB-like protein/DNA-binding winged helix-turn-helix (wHTH) protein/cytochrome c-type biogenesis protein CcmH/NrfG
VSTAVPLFHSSWLKNILSDKSPDMATASQTRRIRFGAFEVNLASSEVFKHGIRIKLQDQPFQVLTMLLERPGELIPREELRRKLWADDTFVDFDAGMNAAIRRLRDALNDSADQPRYIETLPRHGYRFIAETEKFYAEVDPAISTVSPLNSVPAAPNLLGDASPRPQSAIAPVNKNRLWFRLPTVAIMAGLILLLGLSIVTWRHRIFRTHASPPIQSIAVLPLQNLSGDPSQEYFADGMTDALITDLAQIKSLRVISRTSSMQFKETKKTLPEIGRELGVDALVEGTVLRSGSRVRINAQLIRADSDRHLWAHSYERSMDDVVALQAEVATRVATEIEANLTSLEKARLMKANAVNPEAYEDYLRGAYFYSKETDEGFAKAIEYYQKAVDLDPSFSPAYVGLAETYGFMAYTRRADPAEAWNKSEKLLAKALELDPNSSLAHTLVGMTKLQYHCDRDGAEKELQRALELNPGDMGAVDYHSYYLLETGRMDEAITEKKKVLEHDPVSVGTSAELGLYFVEAGRYDEAIQQLQKTLELDPNFPPALARLAYAYAGKQKYEQAVISLKKAIALDNGPGKLGYLGDVYARWGRTQESLEIVEELKQMSKQRYVSPELIARIYARLGKKEMAFTYLAKATKVDSPSLSDPGFDSLRPDLRFKNLEARLTPEGECESF